MAQHDDFLTAVTPLGAIEQLDVAALRLLYRVECAGEEFSNQLADRIGNARAADLLRRNGREGAAMPSECAACRRLILIRRFRRTT